MSNVSKHYEKYYGTGSFATVAEAIASSLIVYLKNRPIKSLRLLDIGCGNGTTALRVVDIIVKRGVLLRENISLGGWDISKTGIQEAMKCGLDAYVKDVTNAESSVGEESHYDVIIFSEVLEHVADTGAAMRTIYKILAPGGAVIITTPNLASWYNRILLLFGFQPLMTGLSYEPVAFGNAVFLRMFGSKKGKITHVAGHLRLFTYRALKEFVRYFNFNILHIKGYSSHGDWLSKIISKLWAGGTGSMILLAVKNEISSGPAVAREDL